MDITTAMTPPPSPEQSEYAQKDMSGNSEMMCQILMQLGRLDAKLDMMMTEDKSEDKAEDGKESETETWIPTGSGSSPTLEGISYDGFLLP